MSKHITEQLHKDKFRIVEAPKDVLVQRRHQVEQDRSFELPTALYAATVGLYFAFLGVMYAGLSSPGLVIPMAIFAIFIVGLFGVPAIWTRLAPENESQPLTLGKFGSAGIMTHTGRLAARDATIQMLILPVLVLLWGVAVVTIVALVA
ncbi:hypothetical protein BPTFM16_00396 [Altererythrobacter insulae]|nr:hypothetical protein BPTFM16_00396 [Altererythrobacter insulae]